MTIVDTSVWIDHFRKPVERLGELLAEMQVLSHSAVIGELALGYLRGRDGILGNLKLLPKAKEASPGEILELIEKHRLYGRGLSLIDAQLLASALLSDAKVFTRDRGMLSAMSRLGIDCE